MAGGSEERKVSIGRERLGSDGWKWEELHGGICNRAAGRGAGNSSERKGSGSVERQETAGEEWVQEEDKISKG